MSFRASGSADAYRGREVGARHSQGMLTAAEDRLGKKRKADRIASEKPDAFKSLASTVGRAGLAYYTLGASETSGVGKEMSKGIVGKRSDGSDYDDPMGDMINVAGRGYNMMEGMKQKDISDLKSEDIATYNRDIDYAKSFAEGSTERNDALVTARRNLENSQTAQNYGDRADTNPFLYTRGRKDAPALDPYSSEGSMPKGEGWYDETGKWMGEGTDPNLIKKSVADGKAEFDRRQVPPPEAHAKSIEEEDLKRKALEERMPTAKVVSKPDTELLTSDDQELSPVAQRIAREDAEREAKIAQMDREEFNKKLFRVGKRKGELTSIPMSDYESDSTEKYRMANEFYRPDTDEPNTYLEKEAKRLSLKDKDGSSVLDDNAFDTKGKALEKRGGFLRGLDRLFDPKQGKEDAQHLLEYNIQKEEEQKRARKMEERTRAGEFTPSIKSDLRKRVEARKRRVREIAIKKGGINVGSLAQ
jgi:hypothetical protein